MESRDRPSRPRELWTTLPLDDVVPARAVLTELARGFLLTQDVDPEGAARFARTFLKEHAGPAPPPPRVVPVERLAAVRRGVTTALREGTQPPFDP